MATAQEQEAFNEVMQLLESTPDTAEPMGIVNLVTPAANVIPAKREKLAILVGQAVTKAGTLGEEGFLKFSGFTHVVSHMRTPMNSNTAEEATIVPIGVQRQNSGLFAEPIR